MNHIRILGGIVRICWLEQPGSAFLVTLRAPAFSHGASLWPVMLPWAEKNADEAFDVSSALSARKHEICGISRAKR